MRALLSAGVQVATIEIQAESCLASQVRLGSSYVKIMILLLDRL